MARAPRPSWIQCVRDQLKQRGFGDKRADDIETRLNNLAARYRQLGEAQPEARATAEIMASISDATRKRAQQTVLTLEHTAADKKLLADNVSNVARNFKKQGYGPIAAAKFEYDPRVRNGGGDLRSNEQGEAQLLWQHGSDIVLSAGKGVLGLQRGRAILRNIPKEVIDGFGSTGDKDAERLARAWTAMTDAGVDRFNSVGGSMAKLERYMPQNWSAPKLFKQGKQAYVDFHNRAGVLDWDRMQHPDGSFIAPGEREAFLRAAWDTLTTGGANKEPGAGSVNGANIANQMDNHRQLHYASGAAWLDALDAYGEGNVFDNMTRHVGSMARQIALVKTFGPNPTMGVLRLRAQTLHAAAQEGGEAVARTKEALAASMGFDGMAETVLRQNPTSEFDQLGRFNSGVAGVLRAAQLGSAVIKAALTDHMSMLSRRAVRGGRINAFDSTVKYFESVLGDLGATLTGGRITPDLEKVFARSGFIHDDFVNGLFQNHERFTYFSGTKANAIGEAFGNGVWRASLAGVHDRAMRRVTMNEHMGFMHDMKDTAHDQLPETYRSLLDGYGIGASEWDAFRQNTPETRMSPKAAWLVPSRVLETSLPNKEDLFTKFNSMLHNEAYLEFMDRPTVALQAGVSRLTGAHGLLGVIARSALMYKSFPLTWTMTTHRLVVARASSSGGRIAMWAAMATAMGAAGAATNLMYDALQGKKWQRPDNKDFYVRAMATGGGLGLLGDLLTGAAKDNGAGVNDVVAGPLLGLAGQTAYTGYSWAKYVGGVKDSKGRATGIEVPAASTAKLAERYVPGANLWYARLLLQRELFDQLDLTVNPQAARRSQKAAAHMSQKAGSPYWWRPGATAPNDSPGFAPPSR